MAAWTGPEDLQQHRYHHDAAADAHEAGRDTGGDADQDQPERGGEAELQALFLGRGVLGSPVTFRRDARMQRLLARA